MQGRAPAGSGLRPARTAGLAEAFGASLPDWDCRAQPAHVHVGVFDLRDWDAWTADAYDLLDAAERGRVGKRRSPAQRDELALAYALHRLLLGSELRCDPARVPIGRDAAGCPRVFGSTVATSLSHAGGAVAVAVSTAGPVGVDIEASARAKVMPEIAERILHRAETAGTAGELLALWVRKEALLKAAGTGLMREMRSFAAPEWVSLALPDGRRCRVSMLELGAQWTAAIASTPGVSIDCRWLRPVDGLVLRAC